MGSTYLSLHYHLVFATKNREPIIAPDWRARLHEYLGGTVNGLGGFSQGTGDVADHVHLLAGLTASHRLSDFVREAIAEKLQREGGERPSAYDIGKSLFGKYGSGRDDLSGNRKTILNEVLRAKHRR